MTFEQFLEVKIGGLMLVLWALAWVLGMMLSREKSLQRRIETLTDEFRDTKPTDRLPSKREKKKMKSYQREIRKVKDESATLHKNKLVLDVVFAGVFVALGIFLIPGRVLIGLALLLGALMVANLIFNTVAYNWRASSMTAFFLLGVAVIMLIGAAADEKMRIIHEAVTPAEAVQETPSATPRESNVVPREPDATPRGPSAFDPQNPDSNDATGESANNELVDAILRDIENDYYDKHVAELEPYTDEFGLDLDKMLDDYGYRFVAYDLADNIGLPTPQLPAVKSYWLVFSTGDGFVLIHTCGGWAICVNGGDEYLMMPSLYDMPDIAVSLHEKNFVVNHKVVALIMEFLDGQPKMAPRNASGMTEFKV